MRSLILSAAVAAAYVLLRGWPPALPVLVRLGLAVLLIAPALALWVPRKRPGNRVAARRLPGRIDALALGVAILAVEGAFVVFLGLAPAPLESLAERIDTAIRPERHRTESGEETDQGPRPGNWLWHTPGSRRLPQRGSYRPGNRPEVFLRTRDRDHAALMLRRQIYVSAFSLEQFDQAEWSVPSLATTTVNGDPAGFVRFTERPGLSIPHEIFHAVDPSGRTPLIGLQGMVAAKIEPLERMAEALHMLPPIAPDAPGYDYLVISKPSLISDLPADAGPVTTDVPGHLLALPQAGTLAGRLRELASLAAGSGDPATQLANLRTHLRTTLDYSLETTNPQNLDPLENFLFDEQRGHCELFATAGALLARTLGMPSRVTYGWSGGRYFDSPNMFVFRARDAHAWAEVWIEGRGWVVLDPTPPGARDAPNPSVADPGETVPGTDDELLAEDDEEFAGTDLPRSAWWLLAALTATALALALIRGFTVRRRHSSEGSASAPSPLNPPDYLLEFRNRSALAGHPLPTGRTLRNHLATLGPDLPAVVHELIDYHYTTRYESAPRNPAAERRLIRELRTWQS